MYYSSCVVRVHRQLVSVFAYGVEKSKDHDHNIVNDGSSDDSCTNHNDSLSSLSPLPSPCLHPSPSNPLPVQSTEI